jgi:hypothetical protein
VSRTWAESFEWSDDSAPAADEPRREPRSRRRQGRRRLVALCAVVAAAVALAVVATSLARGDDAFVGVWWEPASGRRVEIVRDGDTYTLLYGAQRRPFSAERRGDEPVIAAPLGGDIVVRAVTADKLELEDGGHTTTLQPAPDGS